MVNQTLLVSASVVLVMGILYAVVGRAVLDRRTMGPERLAREAFALWWFGFSVSTITNATRKFIVAFGFEDLALHVSLTHFSFLALFTGLWGLMYYLLYVYTGWKRVSIPLGVFYGLFFTTAVYVITAQNPVALDVGQWQVGLSYGTEIHPVITMVLLAALVLPLVVGAALYLLLYFKVDEPLQKTRILLVGGALVVWFGATAVAVFTGLNQIHYWPLASRIIALLAAVIILYAFTGLTRNRRLAAAAEAHRSAISQSG